MSVLPDDLLRYQKFIGFMLKYWNSDLFANTASQAMDKKSDKDNSQKRSNP